MNISATLPYLRHFHAIASNRNLARAAEELHLSAPAVTHALKQLEEIIGVTLCVRSRSGFELTVEGAELFESTKLIFEEISHFSNRMTASSEGGGHLHIGVIDRFENPIYENVLRKVGDQFPSAFLSIVVLPAEEIVLRLLKGDLDIGFGIFWEKNEILRFQKIGEERLAYYISSKHPLFKKKSITRESVKGMPSLWLDNESKTKLEIEREIFNEKRNYGLQIRAFTNGTGEALKLLRTGKYIVPLPDNVLPPDDKEFRRIDISKGPKLIDEHVAYNATIRGSKLRNFVVGLLEHQNS